MNDRPPKSEIMTIEEATMSNVHQIAMIVQVLERMGLCAKRDQRWQFNGLVADLAECAYFNPWHPHFSTL